MRVRVASGTASIVEAMKSPTRGLSFLDSKPNGLPPYTFISLEAVSWVLEQVEGIATDQEAVELLQKMMDERLVCHASGSAR